MSRKQWNSMTWIERQKWLYSLIEHNRYAEHVDHVSRMAHKRYDEVSILELSLIEELEEAI